MTPDGNAGLHKGMKNTGNGNYMGKPTRVLLLFK